MRQYEVPGEGDGARTTGVSPVDGRDTVDRERLLGDAGIAV